MNLERVNHEVLAVEVIKGATVRTQHTMFAHIALSGPTVGTVGAELTYQANLVEWDTREPITGEERDLVVLVDGQQVAALTTSAGATSVSLRFETPGTYLVEITGDRVTGAATEVTVA